jgi:hypothetical protein
MPPHRPAYDSETGQNTRDVATELAGGEPRPTPEDLDRLSRDAKERNSALIAEETFLIHALNTATRHTDDITRVADDPGHTTIDYCSPNGKWRVVLTKRT